ncbi:hypothetical protein [Rufibacter sp. LB8]|uniref:hypothetical protein n=1 Tax=Rufibacter sp. LB8 TaxID=2777781 RepID=UPI00178C75A4|nr:hypothetical protein [Rufibacter sp. LB8]
MAKKPKRHPFDRPWRRDLLVAGLISMLLAMALLLYTFGLTSDFIFRLFNAFLGIFILLAGTAFVIVPGVNWLFSRFSGKKKTKPAAFVSPSMPKRNVPKARPREG